MSTGLNPQYEEQQQSGNEQPKLSYRPFDHILFFALISLIYGGLTGLILFVKLKFCFNPLSKKNLILAYSGITFVTACVATIINYICLYFDNFWMPLLYVILFGITMLGIIISKKYIETNPNCNKAIIWWNYIITAITMVICWIIRGIDKHYREPKQAGDFESDDFEE